MRLRLQVLTWSPSCRAYQHGSLLTCAILTAGTDIESILRSITGWVTGLAGDEDRALQDRIDQNEELHAILGRVSSLVEGLAGRSGDSVEIDVVYNLDVEVGWPLSPCPACVVAQCVAELPCLQCRVVICFMSCFFQQFPAQEQLCSAVGWPACCQIATFKRRDLLRRCIPVQM